MMATALVTATLVGSFMESAQAGTGTVVGEGNEATGSRRNFVDFYYKFQVFTIDPNGVERKDEDEILNNDMGIFTGAIENFTGEIIDIKEQDEREKNIMPAVGIFKYFSEAKFDKPTTLNLNAIFNSSRIEYILSSQELQNKGIAELALIIDGLDGIDTIQAVNDIKYIIQEGLFGKVNMIRVKSTLGEQNESEALRYTDTLDSKFVVPTAKPLPDRVVQVPESSTNNSLLTLGALGVGVLLKRKVK